MNSEQILKLVLRIMGSSSLLALIFVVAPEAWMASIHEALGLGPLPDEPIVGYLARSTSAFYAMLGGLFWVLSFDLARYHQLLRYLAASIIALGVALLGVDVAEGMPAYWTVWEGPFIVVFGIAILVLNRGVEQRP